MARRAVTEDIHYIDPMFSVPEGTAGYIYRERNDYDDIDVEGAGTAGGDGQVSEGAVFPPSSSGGVSEIPDTLIVVQQQLRTTSTGSQVVDLLVEVPLNSDNVELEFKVAKV